MKLVFNPISQEFDYIQEAGSTATYTGTADIDVGNISAGQSFSDANIQDMFSALINQELFPTLTNPSSSFSLSPSGYQEVGNDLSLSFSSSFNRGSINPDYGTSGYRSGLPNQYNYSGTGLSDNPSTSLSDNQSVASYTVLLGSQSWSGSVSYDEGEQPLSNYGNDYDNPLPAGTTSTRTRTITGVYPYFATTSDITTYTKQSLTSMSSTYVQVDMVAESGSDKQTIDFPIDWSAITGIEFYNTVSGSWEFLGGSKANSLTTFDVTSTTHTVQGSVINYNRFTNNGALSGSRQLRFYTN